MPVHWLRATAVAAAIAAALGVLFSLPAFGQNPQYYQFADSQGWPFLPNRNDVVSNLPFLVVGFAGLARLWRGSHARSAAWNAFFGAIAAVALGSAWFHWAPSDATLVWDRLPMTFAFTSLLVALLEATGSTRLARIVLGPALLLAGATVFYWRICGDLRPYFAVQAISLLGATGMAALFPLPNGWRRRILGGLACYALAFAAEQLDRPIFESTLSLVSGHTVKHLLAAAGCGALALLHRNTQPAAASVIP